MTVLSVSEACPSFLLVIPSVILSVTTLTIHEFQANFVPGRIIRTSHLQSQIKRISPAKNKGRVVWVVNNFVGGGSMCFGIFSRKDIHGMDFVLSPRRGEDHEGNHDEEDGKDHRVTSCSS